MRAYYVEKEKGIRSLRNGNSIGIQVYPQAQREDSPVWMILGPVSSTREAAFERWGILIQWSWGYSHNHIMMIDLSVFVSFACYCTKVIHVQSIRINFWKWPQQSGPTGNWWHKQWGKRGEFDERIIYKDMSRLNRSRKIRALNEKTFNKKVIQKERFSVSTWTLGWTEMVSLENL